MSSATPRRPCCVRSSVVLRCVRSSARFARPVSESCNASYSCWVATSALRRTASIGSSTTSTRTGESTRPASTRGARHSSRPEVTVSKRMSSSRCRTIGARVASATAVPTRPWLTTKKTSPATKMATRWCWLKLAGVAGTSPATICIAAREAAKVSVYCATLNTGRRASLPRRRSSSTSGRAWARTTTPSGADTASASANVVEIVTSSVRPAREIWMGSSSATTSVAASTMTSSGWCSRCRTGLSSSSATACTATGSASRHTRSMNSTSRVGRIWTYQGRDRSIDRPRPWR